MKTHHLKTWPEFFEAVRTYRKTFEVRRDDRDFQVGDDLLLAEWNPTVERYTGRTLTVRVTYKLRGGEFGIEAGFCVLGLDGHGENARREGGSEKDRTALLGRDG